jgi:hypothetical protein
MVGLRQLRSNPAARVFAQSILEQAQEKCQSDSVREFGLGRHAVAMYWSREDDVALLATRAFPHRPPEPEDGRTQVFVVRLTGDGIVLPDFEWAREWINRCAPIPTALTSPYRVFIDKNQGAIYCHDPQRSTAVIILRDSAEIDSRSLITPFRVLWSWIGSSQSLSIIHAGVVSVRGQGILLAGPSGSGKSTLTFDMASHGAGQFLADDCVVVENTRAYALYSRAKVSLPNDTSLGGFTTSNVPDYLPEAHQAKSFIQIEGDEPWFCQQVELVAIAFPVIAGRLGSYRIDLSRAQRMLTDDSTRELFGGSPQDTIRMAKLAGSLPAYRLLLGEDRRANTRHLETLIEN